MALITYLDMNTDFRLAVKRLIGNQQLTINSVICFFKVNKACKEVFAIFPRFLKDLLQSEDLVRGAATWTETALTIQFGFHYFTAFPFKAFGIH